MPHEENNRDALSFLIFLLQNTSSRITRIDRIPNNHLMKKLLTLFAALSTLSLTSILADESNHKFPLVFSEDFEKGFKHWELSDPKGWTHREVEKNHVFGIKARKNNYKPKVRSPHHIALIKDIELSDFVLTFRVRSTKDTGNHRDCCVFFNHQDPTHFYYVHLGAKPDPHSGQIMIVNDAPRKALTENKNKVPWTNEWHEIKVERDSKKGTINVYFDDMKTPVMTATDKTFGKGRVGIGSFDDMNDFDDLKLWGR